MNKELRLEGKVAIITGAGNGFGEATARRFVEEGCRVVATDIRADNSQSLSADLGDACVFVQGDHCSDADNRRVVDTAIGRWGKIDILFNNAGIGWTGDFDATDDALLERMLDTNLKGPWRMTQAALSALRHSAADKPQEGSVLLFTSSGLGLYGFKQSSAYATSKHGVIGLMRSLAHELGPQNIRVNAICPGIADTAVGRGTSAWGSPEKVFERLRLGTPLQRLIEPIDVANAALFLACSEGRSIHNVTLRVDGGANT